MGAILLDHAIGQSCSVHDAFFNDLAALMPSASTLSPEKKKLVFLLNMALMQRDPIAQTMLSASAAETAGQEGGWNDEQRRLLEALAVEAQKSAIGSVDDRNEVAKAIDKQMGTKGFKHGVRDLLDTLGLGHLRGTWSKFYDERSDLAHGRSIKPGAKHYELAERAVILCGCILVKDIAREIPLVDEHIDRFYKL
jgi:hypothetical protein